MESHAAPFLSIKNNCMKASTTARELIIKSLKEKAIMKLEIYKQSKELFKLFKENLQELNADLAGQVNTGETKLGFNYAEKSDHEASISFAGDTLIFHLHSNVFNFDKSHFMYNSPYIKQDEDRAYCSVINVYNFLTDSFKYNREHDIGYLIARIFINKDKHFFVEGKRQLGYLYNDFGTSIMNKETSMAVIESAVLYAIDFDLLTPNYEQVKQVSIGEIYYHSEMLQQKTGKRMGFLFQADNLD
jgi:hypothetical protein